VLFRAYLTAVDPALTSDGTVLHIWLEDTCIGAPAGCTESYTLVDVRADGTPSEGNQANDSIADKEPSFSRDGRYVVFSTTDKSMIAGRTINNGSQVYLRDTCIGAPAGCTSSTILVSEWPNMATSASRAYVGWRSVSEHGRYVAFMHQGDQIGNFYAPNIFVRDTCIGAPAGCTPSTSMASSDPDGINPATSKDYRDPAISSDGHYVVFSTPQVVNGGQIFLALTGY
jgi:Tol biopolymer transport system component